MLHNNHKIKLEYRIKSNQLVHSSPTVYIQIRNANAPKEISFDKDDRQLIEALNAKGIPCTSLTHQYPCSTRANGTLFLSQTGYYPHYMLENGQYILKPIHMNALGTEFVDRQSIQDAFANFIKYLNENASTIAALQNLLRNHSLSEIYKLADNEHIPSATLI